MRHTVRVSLSSVFVPSDFAPEHQTTTLTRKVLAVVVASEIHFVPVFAVAEYTPSVVLRVDSMRLKSVWGVEISITRCYDLASARFLHL